MMQVMTMSKVQAVEREVQSLSELAAFREIQRRLPVSLAMERC